MKKKNNMLEAWSKYKRILDREDKEFRRAMEEEVSTLPLMNISKKMSKIA